MPAKSKLAIFKIIKNREAVCMGRKTVKCGYRMQTQKTREDET
jgi:hypothetical protein